MWISLHKSSHNLTTACLSRKSIQQIVAFPRGGQWPLRGFPGTEKQLEQEVAQAPLHFTKPPDLPLLHLKFSIHSMKTSRQMDSGITSGSEIRRSGRSINLDAGPKWDGKTGQGVNDVEVQGMGISCEWIGARREDLGKLQSWLSYLSTLVTHWNPLGTLQNTEWNLGPTPEILIQLV